VEVRRELEHALERRSSAIALLIPARLEREDEWYGAACGRHADSHD